MKRVGSLIRETAMVGTAAGALLLSVPACAQGPAVQDYDISAQDLASALSTLAHISGFQLAANGDLIAGRKSGIVHGHFSPQEALDAALVGTGLTAMIAGDTIIIRGRSSVAANGVRAGAGRSGAQNVEANTTSETEITVTGTRIKGAPPTFPVTTLTRDQIQARGENDLGEVIRSLPQNFNGGQNPGVGFGAAGSENVTSGSALNLRGLGSDATLTLLNGHRLAYDSADQSIDISAIPVAAIERLEIVPDGASALYGSDAVGGVANIILRRDFSGLDTQVRLGSTTEGGGLEQEYSGVGGARWSSGGFIATADVGKTATISAGDRAITSTIPSDTTLNPSQRVQSFVLSGHQGLGGAVVLSLDGYYTHRASFTTSAYALPDVSAYGSTFHTDLKSWSIAPKVSVSIGSAWQADVQGVHGQDNVTTRTTFYFAGENAGVFPVDYANRLNSIEAGLEGPLIALPAGEIRLAAGGGYRSVGLHSVHQSLYSGVLASDDESRGSRRTAYGYGELFVPVFGPANARAGFSRLDLTLAGRFEHDAETGSVFTPKVGLNYEPTRDFGFEASWGRSFKEPTLDQQTAATLAVLGPASSYATGYPAGATVLVRDGGNPGLKPERARTWSGTFKLHPARIADLHAEVSYFDIHYRNRILAPISNLAGALTDPLYAELITYNPSASALDAIVSAASGGLQNSSGQAYDPANVIAIVDNRYRNLSRFNASGVDIAVAAIIHLFDGAVLTPSGSASYLKSSQITLPGGASLDRAGTIYNPPHWRARIDAPLTKGSVTIAPAVDVIGGVTDTTSANDAHVRGMTTFDLTLRYIAGDQARIKGLEVALSVANLANRMPGRVSVPDFYYPAFDSANYSAQGRFVSLTVGKRW